MASAAAEAKPKPRSTANCAWTSFRGAGQSLQVGSVTGPPTSCPTSQPAASSTPYTLSLTYQPDGDPASSNDGANGNWTYSYDALNRLLGTGGAQSLAWVYDQFGNRWQQNYSNGQSAGAQLTFNGPNNVPNNQIDHASGCSASQLYCYDASGNLLNDGTHQYTYDGEGRISSVDSGATAVYTYDAEGRRVRKVLPNSGNYTNDFLYDLDGHAITTLNSSGGWLIGEAFGNGQHLATYGGGWAYFAHGDWLGTERARTNGTGGIDGAYTSWPYGDNLGFAGGHVGNVSPLHFTGKYLDKASNETGLTYFGARYYHTLSLGRFMTPDPGQAGSDPGAPQSWNGYSYADNNPIGFTDLDGRNCVSSDGGKTWRDDGQGGQSCADSAESQEVEVTATAVPPTPAQVLGFDSNYNRAIIEQYKLDVEGGKQPFGPMFLGEMPIIPELEAAGTAQQLVRSVQIVERDGEMVRILVETTRGDVEVVAEMTREGDTLVLRKTDIAGTGPGQFGGSARQALREGAQTLGKQEGVRAVRIEPNPRSTGSVPGKVGPAITINVQ